MIIYTQPKCGNCVKLKGFLDNENMEYQECADVPLMIEKGFKSTPMLELDDGSVLNYHQACKWLGH